MPYHVKRFGLFTGNDLAIGALDTCVIGLDGMRRHDPDHESPLIPLNAW